MVLTEITDVWCLMKRINYYSSMNVDSPISIGVTYSEILFFWKEEAAELK